MFKVHLTSVCILLSISCSGIFARTDADLEVLSFQLINKLIVIQAEVDGAPGNFVFDTGSKNLMLNEKYFEGTMDGAPLSSMSGQRIEAKIKFVDFRLGAFPAQEMDARIINLDAMEQYTNMKIHGLIGVRIFRKSELMIDYTNKEIRIYELDQNGERLFQNEPAQLPHRELELGRTGHIPCFTASLNGQKIRLSLDTGASTNVISEAVFKKNTSSFSAFQQNMLAGLGNHTKAVTRAIVENIQAGSEFFNPMETLIYDFNYVNPKLEGVDIDGILGYPFLKQFRISINFKKQKIYLWENKPVVRQEYLVRDQRN